MLESCFGVPADAKNRRNPKFWKIAVLMTNWRPDTKKSELTTMNRKSSRRQGRCRGGRVTRQGHFAEPQGPDGLPGPRWHLVVARNVLDPTEMKFFVSNASPETSVGTILLAAFSRWRVERCFEDGKGEVGLDHYEGRRYPGLKRHLILSAISYLFLATDQPTAAGEKNPS